MSDQPVTDQESGLFSEAMLTALLPSRVATARRTLRQLGLILITIDGDVTPSAVAGLVTRAIRDSDVAARLDDGTIALVLEFTPSEGCAVVVDRMRRRVQEDAPDARFRAGIACYPAHAISADELTEVARAALAEAPDGEVVVAAVPD
ncbi:MAG: diguanylate cyclase [Acidimicrobiales bacterium]|nr:diguanylate cyclase [Acidimicrobiales bacterium]